jgi:hypothetical protein
MLFESRGSIGNKSDFTLSVPRVQADVRQKAYNNINLCNSLTTNRTLEFRITRRYTCYNVQWYFGESQLSPSCISHMILHDYFGDSHLSPSGYHRWSWTTDSKIKGYRHLVISQVIKFKISQVPMLPSGIRDGPHSQPGCLVSWPL